MVKPFHDPNRILFLGDVHGHFEHVLRAVRAYEPKAIVFLGDVQAKKPLQDELTELPKGIEPWFIHGNHDTDSQADYDHLWGSDLSDRNLDGRVVVIAGVTVAGLGGIFRGETWKPPEAPAYRDYAEYKRIASRSPRWRGKSNVGLQQRLLKHHSSIFPATYDRLLRLKAQVLVTHEAGSQHQHGFPAIKALATGMGVQAHFHGHHHEIRDYPNDAAARYRSHSVGFCGVVNLNGKVLG